MTAATILHTLAARGQTLACAESLTGGLLVAALVDVPGASRVVRGGVVAYARDLKASVLGVDPDLLDRRGAVDPDVAVAMAHGVCRVLGAQWGVATTGVAGPDSDDGMPVGVVYVAATGPRIEQVRRLDLGGTRAQIRAGSVRAALEVLADAIG